MSSTAVLSSFAAGFASFFAPCAFPLLPGYLGYYASKTDQNRSLRGTVIRGLAGSAGILITFLALAAVVAVVGQSVIRRIYLLEPVVGAVLVVLGAMLLFDWIPNLHVSLPARRSSVWGFGVFGAGYAISATSCFAPMFFAVVLGAATVSVDEAVRSVLAFGTGLALPLALTTVLAGIGFDLGANFLPGTAKRLSRLAGLVILLAGLWQLWRTIPGFL